MVKKRKTTLYITWSGRESIQQPVNNIRTVWRCLELIISHHGTFSSHGIKNCYSYGICRATCAASLLTSNVFTRNIDIRFFDGQDTINIQRLIENVLIWLFTYYCYIPVGNILRIFSPFGSIQIYHNLNTLTLRLFW